MNVNYLLPSNKAALVLYHNYFKGLMNRKICIGIVVMITFLTAMVQSEQLNQLLKHRYLRTTYMLFGLLTNLVIGK